MRVIEPHHLKQPRKKANGNRKIWVVAVSGMLALGIGYVVAWKGHNINPFGVLSTNGRGDERVQAPMTSTKLATFSGEQFKQLYESIVLALPNTEPLTAPPAITGDIRADMRIRQLAEQRGFVLRSVPVRPIEKTSEIKSDSDNLLQPRAYSAWKALKAKAKKDKIPLELNSGYRSVSWQREYFLSQLRARGISNQQIARGLADGQIIDVMQVVAPPGYSRHHTGYTVDLLCRDSSGRAFEFTSCFNWLKRNNYEIAKNYGWMPSYPEGVDKQGPEPEPWEYVWVGRSQLLERT